MSTRADHLRLLNQGPFPLPPDSPALSAAERELLVKCGFWLEGLANGVLVPFTAEQARFVQVAKGRLAAANDHERAWTKIRPPVPKQAPPAVITPANISRADESVLGRLRSLLARGEVTSGFADNVLKQWEENRRVTPKQMTGIRRLVTSVDARADAPRVVTGGSRKPGSHRSNW